MINFPKLHIAESVMNRILNARDDLGAVAPARTATRAPDAAGGLSGLPDAAPAAAQAAGGGYVQAEVPSGTRLAGGQLEQAISTPPPPMAMLDDPATAALAGTVAGGADLIDLA